MCFISDSGPVQDLPPNETIRGFILSVPAEQGNEVLRTLDQLTALFGEDGGDDDDDNRTSVFIFYNTRNIA